MAAEFEIPPVHIVGRYALYDEIATGGMATVHFGRLRGAAGFARTVAIKRLHAQFARNAEFVSMFVDEARLAARIRHPNVVQTIDVVSAAGELFLVMEYVQGESLSRLMRLLHARRERMPVRVVASVIAGALSGLHAAHETKDEQGSSLGLVHRDVSPQNILLGGDGLARVLDFGIARARGRVHTSQVGKLKGKLSYMSPEQIDNGVVARQADIYSASVVLWELLTGKRLFHADSPGAVVAKVLAGKIPPPSSVNPAVPPLYDAVVMKGLAPDPAHRYGTAREMATALEACAGSESLATVAAWLEGIAGESLGRRAEQVARLEAGSEVSEISELRALVDELASGTGNGEPPSASAVRQRSFADETLPRGATLQTVALDADLPTGKPRRTGLWLGLAVVGLAAAGAFFGLRGEPAPPEAAAPETAPTAAKPAEPPAPPVVEQVAAEPEPAPIPSVSASAASPPPPTPKGTRRPASKRPASKPASPFSDLGGRQ